MGTNRWRGAVLGGVVVLAATLAGCSSGSGAGAGPASITRKAGPIPTISGPMTGGTGIDLVSSRPLDLPTSWVQQEFEVSGTATSYSAASFPSDGRFHLTPKDTASYATRIVVRRPAKPADFNGTVVVEWLNVSGGLDASPDYTYEASLLTSAGYAWVGVSAQYIGVEGGPTAVSIPGVGAIAGAGKGIVHFDPARYSMLHHPGDAYSYDIFTQVARALRNPGRVDPLGSLKPKLILGEGESQSAYMLTTYIDGVQPLEHQYDGFLVHSRGGAPAPLGEAGSGIGIAQTVTGSGHAWIRTDTDVPVIMVETETDVLGILDYYPATQPDSAHVRLWEVAGTSHVDNYQIGAIESLLGCSEPINSGPDTFVVSAALAHLDTWAAGGAAPPHAPRFDITGGSTPAYVRDANGNVEGGVRTPELDVPVATYSGLPAPHSSIICTLSGSTVPLPASRLAQLYPTRADYLAKYTAATDAAIRAGFMLQSQRAAILADAQPDAIPG